MKNVEKSREKSGKTITISTEEYEKFQAQSRKISELEKRVEILMDALRLERHRQFISGKPRKILVNDPKKAEQERIRKNRIVHRVILAILILVFCYFSYVFIKLACTL